MHRRNATWTLSNFVRGKPKPAFQRVRGALPILGQLLQHDDPETLIDACWGLSYISDGPNDQIAEVLALPNLLQNLGSLLVSPDRRKVTPALRTIGNLVTGDDHQTQIVLNSGILPALNACLEHEVSAFFVRLHGRGREGRRVLP